MGESSHAAAQPTGAVILYAALMALGLLTGVVLLLPSWLLIALLNAGMFALGVVWLVVGLAGGRCG